ncbi:MAG: ABC transporter ATP-binding protein [Rubrobacter sp.]
MSDTPGTISLREVSKSFRVYDGAKARLLDALSLGRANRGRDFHALKSVDLEVERGTTMGILGRNGAGKSTLLRVIAGNLQPTSGTVRVVGQPIFLQMGAGFNPDYTGRENVMLNGLVLGMERKKILQRFDEIEAFADIGEFMDQPVRTYSNGMRSRLGFAVAVNVEPDILIVDETLSVGDAVFRQMGLQKMQELRDSGSTILFVSHGLGTVRSFCSRAALMHEGRLVSSGETAEIADEYQALLASIASKNPDLPGGLDAIPDEDDEATEAFSGKPNSGMRRGTGEVRITKVETTGEDGGPVGILRPGDGMKVRLRMKAVRETNGLSCGITFRNDVGLEVFATDTVQEGLKLAAAPGEEVIVDFTVKLPLQPGNYGIVAHVSGTKKRQQFFDWIGVAGTFALNKIERSDEVLGLVRLPVRVELAYPNRKS